MCVCALLYKWKRPSWARAIRNRPEPLDTQQQQSTRPKSLALSSKYSCSPSSQYFFFIFIISFFLRTPQSIQIALKGREKESAQKCGLVGEFHRWHFHNVSSIHDLAQVTRQDNTHARLLLLSNTKIIDVSVMCWNDLCLYMKSLEWCGPIHKYDWPQFEFTLIRLRASRVYDRNQRAILSHAIGLH